MSGRLAALGAPEALALTGLPRDAPAERPDVAVLLADAAGTDAGLKIRWFAGGPEPDPEADRRIAPEGPALWRRSPWPAADALFELPAPAADAGTLVAGGSPARRAELVGAVSARGLPVSELPELTPAGLELADAVVLLPSEAVPGHALPLAAMAVLAARRMLLVPRLEVAFGLMPGIDHLQYTLSVEAADLIESARRHRRAFAAMRIWGAVAAQRHRASFVWRRLALDLQAEGLLPPSGTRR